MYICSMVLMLKLETLNEVTITLKKCINCSLHNKSQVDNITVSVQNVMQMFIFLILFRRINNLILY